MVPVPGCNCLFKQARLYTATTVPYNSHSPLTITMTRPISVVEHADRLMQEAVVLFSDQKSIMRSDYRDVVEGHMQ
jgi:hypothetical protein